MGAYVQAGVDIYESTLRYAEVERRGSDYRLLKLGSCEFDFNMAQMLTGGAPPMYLDTLAEALSDVFAESKASDLHVVFHPTNCFSFFTPLFVDMSDEARKRRLQDEATLLTTGERPVSLHLTADAVHTETLDNGRVVEWFHVLGVHEHVHAQLDRILRRLPQDNYRFNLSTRGAANAIETLARLAGTATRETAPFALAIGYYKTHVEFVICRHHRWYFSHFAPCSAPSDGVYFALSLLRRLNLDRSGFGHLYLYGDDVEPEVFTLLQDIFQQIPDVLNPMDVVALDRKKPGMHFDAEAYVPCIGIAM